MTAQELFAKTTQPKKTVIVFRTDEWRDMMWGELRAQVGTECARSNAYQYLELKNGYQYSFCHINTITKKDKYDCVIAEGGIPDWRTQSMLAFSCYHDNSHNQIAEEDDD